MTDRTSQSKILSTPMPDQVEYQCYASEKKQDHGSRKYKDCSGEFSAPSSIIQFRHLEQWYRRRLRGPLRRQLLSVVSVDNGAKSPVDHPWTDRQALQALLTRLGPAPTT